MNFLMRFILPVFVAVVLFAVPSTASADYLISGPNYTTPSGRVCQVKVETYLYDQATYFFSFQVLEDFRPSCGYISGTGFDYPPVWNHDRAPDGLSYFACAWGGNPDRSQPTPGYYSSVYQKTVCQGAPATYRSRIFYGINLMNGARWNLGAGCHLLYSSGLTARQICVNADRTQMEVRHWNTVWVS